MGRINLRVAALSVMLAVLATGPTPVSASPSEEAEFVDAVNAARHAAGKAPVSEYWDLTDDARAHSEDMRAAGEIFHTPDLASVTTGWSVLAENVGVGSGVQALFDAFMDSAPHRANILGDFSYIGVGVADDGGVIWVTMIFMATDGAVFVDIAGSIFEDDILWLTEAATRFACNPPVNDRFCPEAPVERATMAEFVAKTLSLPPAPQDYFVDDEGSPYEDSINRIAAAGITFGCNPPVNDRFCPDRILNRGEMAAFFVRALDLTDTGAGDYFSDDDQSVFESDIDKVAAAGITYGCNPPANTLYCVDRILKRGEIAAFLHRAVG